MTPAELRTHLFLLAAASIDEDEAAELLCDFIERCWNETTFHQ